MIEEFLSGDLPLCRIDRLWPDAALVIPESLWPRPHKAPSGPAIYRTVDEIPAAKSSDQGLIYIEFELFGDPFEVKEGYSVGLRCKVDAREFPSDGFVIPRDHLYRLTWSASGEIEVVVYSAHGPE